jgi:transposase
MSRKKRYIENLTEEERSSLTKGYKTGASHLFQRKCQCILLSNEGYTVNQLSELFGVTIQSIYKWFNRWESGGIKALELQPGRGRKPKLELDNKEHVQIVKELVENEPKSLRYIVGKLESEHGFQISKMTLLRFLKSLDTAGKDSELDLKDNLTQKSTNAKKVN